MKIPPKMVITFDETEVVASAEFELQTNNSALTTIQLMAIATTCLVEGLSLQTGDSLEETCAKILGLAKSPHPA